MSDMSPLCAAKRALVICCMVRASQIRRGGVPEVYEIRYSGITFLRIVIPF